MSLLDWLFGGHEEPARGSFRAEPCGPHEVRVTTNSPPSNYDVRQATDLPGVHGGAHEYNERAREWEITYRVDGDAGRAAGAINNAYSIQTHPAANGAGQVDWTGREDYRELGRWFDEEGY